MRWSVVVPGALIPAPIASDVIGALEPVAPALSAWMREARPGSPQAMAEAVDGAAHLGWLWQRFGGETEAPVTAPYAWAAATGADGDGSTQVPPADLWQIDPVHFAFARDHLLVAPLEQLRADEVSALVAEADAVARPLGATVTVRGGHWFLTTDRPWRLSARPLAAALGESVQHQLPAGEDAALWRRLLTEIQIAWHAHPVNAAREERGAPAINGLWLHGGGTPAPLSAPDLQFVATADLATRGWAQAAGVSRAAIVAHEALPTDARGDALVVWPQLFTAAKAEAWGEWLALAPRFDRWLATLIEAAAMQGADLELVLAGRRHVHTLLRRSRDPGRWLRRWRRAALANWLAEPLPDDTPAQSARP